MILRVMKNSALSAKIHAMSGTALHQKDYDALMRLHTVPAVAAYLKENTRYQNALKDAVTTTLHRGRLEQLLHAQILTDILALLHYTDTDSTFFLKALEMQDGIEKLKVFLRLLHIGHPEQITKTATDFPLGNKQVKVEDLAQITTFSALMDLIKPTPYHQALRSFSGDPKRQELFYLEVALDSYWAQLIHRYAKKYLSSEEAKLALKLYGTEADLNNLIFLLRCKERFQMTQEEIYACIIPIYYRLTEQIITEIVTCPSVNDAFKIIHEKTPYGLAFHENDRFLEKRKNEYMAQMYRRIGALHPYSIQAAISYVHLRRIEINNIVSIIEGIRYGLKPEQISEYLIGYSKEEVES
ncbi:V-type ATPase subunit [Ructibacterium gallinarum]|uniref:V-type ATPase subunit n=1 Tax=Ructibacterium gallinarum TaxID=2779355 RepID=A0A9D5R7Z7_9FIRM|nr:V-type ATPase subunit [Ructibacterium gallinarum]MBE5039432.1 V-type ATPase subunit [Ructibacterium gallinarum]